MEKNKKSKSPDQGESIRKEEAVAKQRSAASGSIILDKDLGILLFVFCVGIQAVITVLMGESAISENLILLAGILAAGELAVMQAREASMIITAFWVVAFTVYRLYEYFAYQADIPVYSYFEPFILILADFGILIFMRESRKLEKVIDSLNKEVEELTIIDPLTQLENMKSLNNTLTRQMATAVRNHSSDFGLIIIRLRYPGELKKILTENQFNVVRIRIANICQNTLRIEDRVFTIDQNGSIAVVYFSKAEGAERIKERLLESLTKKDAFPKIAGNLIRTDFQIVYKQYDESFERDALRFFEKTEAEFAYEV